ncbi:MAG TPA: hypothetical protein VGH63_07090 [Polyangia bacterium]|jgi:hypothetical protein
MTTKTKKTMLRLVGAFALATLAACGGNGNNNGSPDMTMMQTGSDGGVDMGQLACVMNPMTGTDILNACTTSQTGDPAKDAPYFPSLAPNGNLPPLP